MINKRLSSSDLDDYEVLEQPSVTESVRNLSSVSSYFSNKASTKVTIGQEMWKELNKNTFLSFFDEDGRLTNESIFCESVFNGGCGEDIRCEAWKFLFNMYPMQSTLLERSQLKTALFYKYEAMKAIVNMSVETALQEDELKYNDIITSDKIMKLNLPSLDVVENSHDGEKMMAKIYSAGLDYDLSVVKSWYTVLEKDIPRTDKDNPYFCEEKNIAKLRNILRVYAFFHPTVGYVQGMNDILTRFLVVLDDEVDAYWCFAWHMDRVQDDFKAESMMEKIKHVQCLLREIDPDLYRHFSDCQMHDVIFCHRWLLLSFKREFTFSDSIKYFEIISSKHFGLNTLSAAVARNEQFEEELRMSKGELSNSSGQIENCFNVLESWYSIEIFVCIAVILLHKEEFLACTDSAEVSHVACHLIGKLNLYQVLEKSQEILINYCKKIVKDDFQKRNNSSARTIKNTFSKFMSSLNAYNQSSS